MLPEERRDPDSDGLDPGALPTFMKGWTYEEQYSEDDEEDYATYTIELEGSLNLFIRQDTGYDDSRRHYSGELRLYDDSSGADIIILSVEGVLGLEACKNEIIRQMMDFFERNLRKVGVVVARSDRGEFPSSQSVSIPIVLPQEATVGRGIRKTKDEVVYDFVMKALDRLGPGALKEDVYNAARRAAETGAAVSEALEDFLKSQT